MKIKFFKAVAAIVAIIIFIFHFFNTALYNMPNNVISTSYTFDKLYISGILSQEWAMFAPNPMDKDTNLIVKCIDSKSKRTTDYNDITSHFNDLRTSNFLVSADRVARVASNWTHLYLSPNRWEVKLQEECDSDKKSKSCGYLKEMETERQGGALRGLTFVASRFCQDISKDLQAFDKAKIIIKIVDVPRWSERHSRQRPKPVFVDAGTVDTVTIKGRKIWN